MNRRREEKKKERKEKRKKRKKREKEKKKWKAANLRQLSSCSNDSFQTPHTYRHQHALSHFVGFQSCKEHV